jgi:ribose 5-phosphate isomerase
MKVDLTIDRADETGTGLVLNKGVSGALLRAKILAHNSERVFIVANPPAELEI